MPGFCEPVPCAVYAIDWRARYGITPEVEAAAAKRGMPPAPVFEVVDAHEGYAWAELARLKGLLREPEPCLEALPPA
jgi:hypothetical protein